jgi:hypothetical protein
MVGRRRDDRRNRAPRGGLPRADPPTSESEWSHRATATGEGLPRGAASCRPKGPIAKRNGVSAWNRQTPGTLRDPASRTANRHPRVAGAQPRLRVSNATPPRVPRHRVVGSPSGGATGSHTDHCRDALSGPLGQSPTSALWVGESSVARRRARAQQARPPAARATGSGT